VNLEFLSTVAVIAPDPSASRKLYVDVLGLPLESHGDDYHQTVARLESPEGAVVGISYAPVLHDQD
jgi:catechol 2,3-dioxygenase-like lactoylglutathione lyase family enzyme